MNILELTTVIHTSYDVVEKRILELTDSDIAQMADDAISVCGTPDNPEYDEAGLGYIDCDAHLTWLYQAADELSDRYPNDSGMNPWYDICDMVSGLIYNELQKRK